MTDILSKLAALTTKDKNGLLPCAVCGHPNEVDGIKPTIESNRRRVVCTHCGLTTIWCDSADHAIETANTRPRESALIALVQEAPKQIEVLQDSETHFRVAYETSTKEIDRLRGCLGLFASVIKSGEPWTEICQREYDKALNPTEAA